MINHRQSLAGHMNRVRMTNSQDQILPSLKKAPSASSTVSTISTNNYNYASTSGYSSQSLSEEVDTYRVSSSKIRHYQPKNTYRQHTSPTISILDQCSSWSQSYPHQPLYHSKHCKLRTSTPTISRTNKIKESSNSSYNNNNNNATPPKFMSSISTIASLSDSCESSYVIDSSSSSPPVKNITNNDSIIYKKTANLIGSIYKIFLYVFSCFHVTEETKKKRKKNRHEFVSETNNRIVSNDLSDSIYYVCTAPSYEQASVMTHQQPCMGYNMSYDADETYDNMPITSQNTLNRELIQTNVSTMSGQSDFIMNHHLKTPLSRSSPMVSRRRYSTYSVNTPSRLVNRHTMYNDVNETERARNVGEFNDSKSFFSICSHNNLSSSTPAASLLSASSRRNSAFSVCSASKKSAGPVILNPTSCYEDYLCDKEVESYFEPNSESSFIASSSAYSVDTAEFLNDLMENYKKHHHHHQCPMTSRSHLTRQLRHGESYC